ncbi:chemotaxis protein [Photobacterium satsumensis]|uniref:chemotaxis protein n=1 Tax=Photobacterium satsumensis TaxID=2910239 RepID=UPI003D0F2070
MSSILSTITSAISFVTTELIVIVIGAIFIFALFKSMMTLRQSKAHINELMLIADKAKGSSVQFTDFSQRQQNWVTEHLVYDRVDQRVTFDKQGSLLLAKSALSQMAPDLDDGKYKLIPAILTSFGITGTFIGITLGLSGFSMAGDSTELLATAMQLLEGMNTAFYTSLVGLMCSAFFMIWMKFSAHFQQSALSKFSNHLTQNYSEASVIHYLKNLSGERQQDVIDAQLRSAAAMESLGGNFNQLLGQFSQLSHSFDGDKIASTISTAMTDSIESQLAPTMVQIRDELALLKDIKEQNQKELLQEIIAEMKAELIAPVVIELEKTSAAVSANNQVSEQLNSNVELVITRTAETVETIDKFQQETMTKLQEFAVSLKDILSSFKDDTQGAMSTIAKEVQTMLDGATTGLAQQRDAFEDSAIKAANSFEGIKESMNTALEERQKMEKELFDGVEIRINTLIDGSSDAFKQQTNVLEKVGSEASTLMNSARVELENGLGDIDSKVQSMSQTVQQELDVFRKQYQENLTSYFEQQNNLLETSLGKQRDGLNGVVENFKNVFESEYKTRHGLLEELTVQHQHLQKSAQTIEKVAKAIGLNEASKMAELQDAAQTMSKEIAHLKREYSKAASTFNDVTEGLPKAMDDYFTRANNSFEVFFKDFDDSASKIHNKLSQAAGYLINAQVQRREFEADEVEA